MNTLFTRSLKNKLIQLLLLLLSLPLLSRAQTVVVNYDFNNTTSPNAPLTLAAGITSAALASKPSTAASGAPTGTNAFVATTAGGNALTMNNLGATSAEYFQVTLDGPSLPKYSAFKLYFQSYRTGTGPTSLALQYSLNGGAYTLAPVPNTAIPGNPGFAEATFDLSATTALNAPTSLSFRLFTSGSSGGNVRLDNFQVQAVNTVDPLLNTLTPATAEAGTPGFNLAVMGSNFKPGAVVSLNGQPLATTYNSATSLTATVPAAAIATAGSYPVVVTNPGNAASAAVSFLVTPALVHWTGKGAKPDSWFDAGNWSTGSLPTPTDEVVLDHLYVTGEYTVSLDQNSASVSIKSLTVKPGVGDSIFVVVPTMNTLPTALTLSNTGTGAVALAIYDKGVVTNASGASSGSGLVVAGTSGATAFIFNGGRYRHASARGHAEVVNNLSSVPGTEQGNFEFQLPITGPGSYSLSLPNRTYGNLILRNRPGQISTSYPGSVNSLVVRGNLLIGPGAVFTATINTTNEVQLLGNVQVQGTLLFRNGSSGAPSQVVVAGAGPQTMSGSISFEPGIGLTINNPFGITLATPLALSGLLTLTSGTLTTTATNLLTLSPAASISGGSPTSFINGPLARQVTAGALTNLVFPIGSGKAYRPLTLSATAQDATAYLVTQNEGPAPDFTNLPASTSALPQLTRVSRARSYTITPTPVTASFSGNATISFGSNDQVNAPLDAGLTVGENSGSGWQNIGSFNVTVATPVPADGYASGTITSGTFTSFGTFALASTSADAKLNPLPVVLVSFAARRRGADVALSWTTASELNNARFEVQRSLDGQQFMPVATVAGHGTAAQAHQYTALDPAAPAELLYYRLAQVDTDGRTTFSPVVALNAGGRVGLYPNPARDRLTISAPAGTPVRVLDLLGRVVLALALPPSGEVSVAALPTGSYVLQLDENAQSQRFKFNKE